MGRSAKWELGILGALALYPLAGFLDPALFKMLGVSLGSELTIIFIYAILALGLNVVVGYCGLLHLGVAAFFGIGAYITGILTVSANPFQLGFWVALPLSAVGAALAGVVLGAPTLRLRGDYLALVTLGFGEVVRFSIQNLDEITNGTRSLNPIPPPTASEAWLSDYRLFYYLILAALVGVVVVLKNLERSRIGRGWLAIREDELAASCMGLNPARIKLSAFALGAAIAGLAGCLYATKITTTAGPNAYDFNRSIITLCCLIIGGMGNLHGVLLGTLLLIGFDNVFTKVVDGKIQAWFPAAGANRFLEFANWRLVIFGLALILMMRLRPAGLLPEKRTAAELGSERADPEVTRTGVE
jgi:branched-chain amino acid transport system permease protein